MSRITEKQLIESLSQFKDIKPRKEWAALLKSQIVVEKQAQSVVNKPARFAVFSNIFSQNRLAYSLATIFILAAGVFGISKLITPGVTPPQTAALTNQNQGQQNVAVLNSKVDNFAKVVQETNTKNLPSSIAEINANAKALAQNLKKNPTQDPTVIKNIATSLKTLADVPGNDLTASPDVQDLTQTVVESQITDLQKTTLTDDQKKNLTSAENLYNQGKYTEALEVILLINQ